MHFSKNYLMLKTIFPKKEDHTPSCYTINATGKTLGRLATEVSILLRGKETCNFAPHVEQGNFVIILNANSISISGKKEKQKLYHRNSHRPGSLKTETFSKVKTRIPSYIIEKAVKGMLPKGILGRMYFRRLYIYFTNEIKYKNEIFNIKKSISN